MEELKRKFYDPRTGLISAQRLYEKVKGKYTLQQVKDWVAKQEVSQLQKDVRVPREGLKITGDMGDYQADLTFFEQYKGSNNGYSIILTIIEIPSRKAWASKLFNKNANSIVTAFD